MHKLTWIIASALVVVLGFWYYENKGTVPGKGWLIIGAVAGFLVLFKTWALKHPKSSIGIIIAAALLVFEEPAEAQ